MHSPSPDLEEHFHLGPGLYEFYDRAVDPDRLVDDIGQPVPQLAVGVCPGGRQAL
ncbi:MAG TPA: hypothetical protein VHL09_01785 [Dehalococcoidia bacterium]|nr:hypothetical protein [Dehalococcoidia bacterium]